MELWRVFRFARFVKKKIKEDKELALESFLITQFSKTKRRWFIKRFSEEQVRDIIKYARKKEYIGRYTGEEGYRKLKISVPKGSELVDFPVGTVQKFAEENGKAFAFFIAILLSPYFIHLIKNFINLIK